MEDILHYVWKHRLFDPNLRTTDGLEVEVIDTGLPNTNQGPDFFNAKIKIGDKVWAGNIEIHQKSEDWNKHGHQTDPNYNSVILHIVKEGGSVVKNEAGLIVPQCALSYPKRIDENYSFLIHSDVDIPCCNYLGEIPEIHIKSWLNYLVIERLERKSNDIGKLLARFNNSWEDVFYILFSRNFGFGLNSDSFERLALSLPLSYIRKHGNNIVQIEALLFGQAGFLESNEIKDDYYSLLKKEYEFLKKKYELASLDAHIFKTLRSRPGSFPEIRLAQLASLIYNSQGLFSKIASTSDLGRIRLMFHHNASEYWQVHYRFGHLSERKSKFPGDSSLDIILINTVVPILFAYGNATDNEIICERAVKYLDEIKAENNNIIKKFSGFGIKPSNATDSQSIIQLKKEYCEKRKCLFCRFGNKILTSS